MTSVVRIFSSEEAVNKATEALSKIGLTEHTALIASGLSGQEESAVQAAIEGKYLPSGHGAVCVQKLKQGRSLVAVNAPYGRATQAIQIMDDCGAVESSDLKPYTRDYPNPLSDMANLPMLVEFQSSTSLLPSDWSLSKMFGIPLLSRAAAPLSRMFAMKTVSSPKRPWNNSLGMPMLSGNPSPLSSLFGMKIVISKRGRKEMGFGGMPLLSDNPAPASSLFGLPTLIKKK